MKRLAILGLLLAGACRVTPPSASASDAERGHVELADLQHGRTMLVRKCGSCHTPPMPSDHLAREWPRMLDEMSQRAGLEVEQRRVIEKYLITMAER
ncbi:MAG: hypothetical protein JWO36_4878 [Myxococcales bacterium]|nr:hypothetical protein [Myxococcales bacterium]